MDKIVSKVNNERLLKWKEDKETIILNPNQITISEDIHMKASGLKFDREVKRYQDKDLLDKKIIIRPLDVSKTNLCTQFTLVMGLRGLVVAKALNKPITCIVVDKDIDFKQFKSKIGMLGNYFKVPEGTEDILNINDIEIPVEFSNSHPSKWKFENYKKEYLKNKCLDNPITVKKNSNTNNKFKLSNGYIRYLIFKKMGIKNIPVKYEREVIGNEI